MEKINLEMTSKGKPKLIYDGFDFVVDKESDTKIYWNYTAVNSRKVNATLES